MQDFPTVRGKRVGIMGLGKSGLSAARTLTASGAMVLVWDDQPAQRDTARAAGLTVADAGLSAEISGAGLDLLLWSPGIAHHLPQPHPVAQAARAAGVRMVCDVDLLLENYPDATVIAITGTNGKSTTTTLIAHLLLSAGRTVAVGGNLGIPALDLPGLGAEGIYVLELSSYQIELLDKAQVDIALLLNLTPDHLARHGDMAGYAAVKASLFDRLRPGGTAIIGIDDPLSAAIAAATRQNQPGCETVTVSVSATTAGVLATQDSLYDRREDDTAPLPLTDLPRLPGVHNRQNIACAWAAARAAGLSRTDIAAGLSSYPGLAHRQELVGCLDGIRFVNDSKATNADATEKAMVCYDSLYWILGGQAKEGGIEMLAPLFPRVRHAFLIGEAADSFARRLQAAHVPLTLCGTLEQAVPAALQTARQEKIPDAVVLLSPACASWDQFRSFEHRGDVFRDLVRDLTASSLGQKD